uniref:FERM domain-containing protein n=1 Tax=Panagrellus redivivus TaxID=6233 RepID=A0A7E4V959_PANRE
MRFDEGSDFKPFRFDDLLKFLKAQQQGFKFYLKVDEHDGEFSKYFSELETYLNDNLLQYNDNLTSSQLFSFTCIDVNCRFYYKPWYLQP